MSNIVVSVWLGLLRLILTFLHLVYSGLHYFDVAWALFKRKYEDIMQLQIVDGGTYVSRFVNNLGKCPSHLAVIIGTDNLNLEDFSNIVIWCLAAGISVLSFYDHTGFLRENENIYFKYLFDKRKLNPKSIILGSNITEPKNGIQKNGYVKKLHVNILSLEDGKPKFVNLVENISKRAQLSKVKSSEIDDTFINDELHKATGYSDPELALICGNVLATFGFLPWQIRLTEFLHINSIEGIRATDFTSILTKYSSCKQRFGK